MKTYDEMGFEEMAQEMTGQMIVAIGQGEFRERARFLLSQAMFTAAERTKRGLPLFNAIERSPTEDGRAE